MKNVVFINNNTYKLRENINKYKRKFKKNGNYINTFSYKLSGCLKNIEIGKLKIYWLNIKSVNFSETNNVAFYIEK